MATPSTLSSALPRRFLTNNAAPTRRRIASLEDQPCSSSACYSGGFRKKQLAITAGKWGWMGRQQRKTADVRCSVGIEDFIGGDLVWFDLGKWLSDVEEHKALAIYPPHEGGYEGRYFTRLRYQGYHFLDLSARGLGDPETTLTKFHPVCPAHVGKQPIARWYFPPEVDYRLSLLPPNAKGLVVWIIEAKVLSKAELQFLALLPTLRPKVRVIAECGNWRKFMWKPLKEIAEQS
nr:NAD(P)H-quinone oxidoreductase subunit N, chloroplastic [Ipomoea batatas]